jgi:hypothetical protein
MVKASLPPATPRKPKKKARCTIPVNIDMTESSTDSKFQETLLDEGCGTQVATSPHPYVFPAYSSGHRYNPHTSCKHVGPSGSLISPCSTFTFPSLRYAIAMNFVAYPHILFHLWIAAAPFSPLLIAYVLFASKSA